jgi:PLP dependent protein
MPTSPANPDPESRDGVLARLDQVQRRMAAAAEAAGRRVEDVTLVTITKTFDAEAVVPVLEAGLRVFGENRVQEAVAKWPALKARWPDIELHLVGPLQTNKAADAVALFDCIQTLDRPKLASVLATEFERQERTLELFVQVNTGAEPQKAGVIARRDGSVHRRVQRHPRAGDCRA